MTDTEIPQYYLDELKYKIEEMVPASSRPQVVKVIDRFTPRMTTVKGINLELPSFIEALQSVVPATGDVPIPSVKDIERLRLDWADDGELMVLVVGARSDEHIAMISQVLSTGGIDIYEIPHVLISEIKSARVYKDVPVGMKYDIVYVPMCLHHMKGGNVLIRKLTTLLNSGGVMVITDYDANDVTPAQAACLEVNHAIIDNVLYKHVPYDEKIPMNIISTKMVKLTLDAIGKTNTKTPTGEVLVVVDESYLVTFDSSVTYYFRQNV